MTANPARQKIFILLFALCFFAMLGASLLQRFQRPTLTARNTAAPTQATMPAGGMGAIGELMRQAAQEPGNQAVLLKLVEALMGAGEWQSAENFAQKALALDKPDNPNTRALYLLAIAHHNKGEHQEAAELLEKLLERQEDAAARYGLAILDIYFLNNPAAGVEHLKKGLASPNLPQALQGAMREELAKVQAGAGVPESAAPEESGHAPTLPEATP